MAMNKKAVFFTLTAILFLSVFLFYPSLYQYNYVTKRTRTAEQRIYALNEYIKNLERDVERSLYISSFRALYASVEYIGSSKDFLNDTLNSFNSAIINGTIDNESFVVLQDSTLPAWIAKVESEGNKLHINTKMKVNDINLYQKDPWFVTVGVNITINVSDPTKTAFWHRSSYIETNINIVGFEDPLYVIHGLGRLTNIINQSPYDGNFTDGTNVTNLLDHVKNSYYVISNMSPSFLMRLEGNLSNSSYGIESMVYLPDFTAQGIPVTSKSSIDSVYWSTDDPPRHRINNTPTWFWIDDAHLDRYGLAGATLP